MKRLFLTLSLLAMTTFVACEQPSDTTSSIVRPDPSSNGHGGGTSSAHLAWTFPSYGSSHGATRYSIAVSDSDGTNLTNVFVSSASTSVEQTRYPTWSPDGGSVSFVAGPPPVYNWYGDTVWGNYSIKAVDVSLTNGVASGSNARTICSYSASDKIVVIEQRWSPTSSVNKIAFIARTQTEWGIYTVSANGGTPTRIYSIPVSSGAINPGPLYGNALGWSNDASQIAFAERDSASNGTISYAIKIINSDGSGTPTTLDAGSDHPLGGVQWSHAGSNYQDVLSYYRSSIANPGNSDWDIYRIDASSGATPTLIISHGTGAFWSPNNTELVYSDCTNATYGVMKKVDIASGIATATSINVLRFGDWKP